MPSRNDMPNLKHRARGCWREVLPALGLPRQILSGKHQPCPMCGGKDRFRFDNKRNEGTWFCSQCGAGDGITLVMKAKGLDFKTAAREIEALIGSAKPVDVPLERGEADKRAAMNTLWRSSRAIQPDDAAGRFLFNRVGITTFPDCLRFARNILYRDDPVSWHPAMLAMMRDPDGDPTILHRTFLTPDGRKADVEEPRRMMQGSIAKGSAVRLMPHQGVLGIAEGIETAFAASRLFGVPCWAALTADLLAQWEPPQAVEEVIVFGDNDLSYAGQAAAFTLAKRLVNQCRLKARVEIPSAPGQDWNDVFADQVVASRQAAE
jgi:putative DNA primase/helicase